nr:putative replicase [Red clover carlavirus 1]
MALTYRSPIVESLSSYTSQEQSEIASSSVTVLKRTEQLWHDKFNYHLSPMATQKLYNAGIYLSPFSFVPHSHPCCKTLENYMLYSVLPNYLDSSFYFIGIKDSKFNALKLRNSKLSLCEVVNRYVTSADKLRYPNDFTISAANCGVECHSFRDLFSHSFGASLKSLLPRVLTIKRRNVFLHDELHYWSEGELGHFLDAVQPACLLATVVIPPELLLDAECSMNKWCYEFEIQDEQMLFYPDGVAAEGYEQPLKCKYLLKTNKIVTATGQVYCVDIVCSKFAHHLVALTRGELKVKQYNVFSDFEAVSAKALSPLLSKKTSCFPMSYSSLSKIYRYLCTLNKPDVLSAVAKLGQIIPEPTAFELKFTMEFAKLVIKMGSVNNIMLRDHFEDFKCFLASFLPDLISQKFDFFVKGTLSDFVSDLCPLKIKQKNECVDLRSSLDGLMHTANTVYSAVKENLVSELIAVPDRTPAPYSMSCEMPAIVYDLDFFLDFCVELCTRNFTFSQLNAMELAGTIRYIQDCVGRGVFDIIFMYQDHYAMLDRVFLKSMFALRKDRTSGIIRRLLPPAQVEEMGLQLVPFVELEELGDIPVRNVLVRGVSDVSSQYQLSVCGCFRCGCGLEMHITRAICPFLDQLEFTDGLRGRSASFYSRNQEGYSYNGGEHESKGWLNWFDELLITHDLEVDYYNCVLAQKYEDGQGIGFHADDEKCFVAHGAVATFQFAGDCFFSVKCNAGHVTEELCGDVFFVMPEGFQDTHKHSVSHCSTGRISLTFRKLACAVESEVKHPEHLSDDVSESSEESVICECFGVSVCRLAENADGGFVPVEVPGDGNCFWHSVGYFLGVEGLELKQVCINRMGYELGIEADEIPNGQFAEGQFAEFEAICICANLFDLNLLIYGTDGHGSMEFRKIGGEGRVIALTFGRAHYMPLLPRNGCVLDSISNALDRNYQDVYRAFCRSGNEGYIKSIGKADGVLLEELKHYFTYFDICAMVEYEGGEYIFNETGVFKKVFQLVDGHLSFVGERPFKVFKALKESSSAGVKVKQIKAEELLLLRASGTALDFKVDEQKADVLLGSLHKARTGVVSSKLFNDVDLIKLDPSKVGVTRKVCCILGTFGAGKSSIFKRLFKKNKGCRLTFVSPRKGLMQDVQQAMHDELGVKEGSSGKKHLRKANWAAYTYETFLKKASDVAPGTLVFLDEAQLFPPGYLDSVCGLLDLSCEIFLVGDPCQSDYDSAGDRGVLGHFEGDLVSLLRKSKYKFMIKSYRFTNELFVGRLPCEFERSGMVGNEAFLLFDGLDGALDVPLDFRKVVLVSSFAEKRIIEGLYGNDCEILTFGESTGRTFSKGTVLVSHASVMTSERRWLTALSRFRENICLLNSLDLNFEEVCRRFKGRCLGSFLTKQATVSDLNDYLPGDCTFVRNFTESVGKSEGVLEEKLMGDPWLKSEIFLGQDPDMQDVEMAEFVEQNSWFKTHLPKCEREVLRSRWVHRIMDKAEREYKFQGLITEQFCDDHSRNKGQKLTNAAERFEAIYPRHKASDTLTFLMAVKKRLRFSKPAIETAKIREAEMYGPFLLKEFLKKIPLKRQQRVDLMEEARRDFEIKKCSKSGATIQNHAGRSCKDWLIDMSMVFSKSQLCTKWGNRFIKAKAAQTIVCFQHAVLCRFAPYMRYIEKILTESLPKNFYVHSGKGLEELNDWVIKSNFTGVCTESDYEAFDASQDHYIMAFEVELMRYLGLPRDLIEDYKFIKTHLGCKLGNFAIMRFSGEASTFLFNTMANMLFTFLRYELNGTEAICFAGDDMCASKRLRVSTKFEDFLSKLKLKAKVDFLEKPTFCGWNLTHFGIYKLPQLVFERLCIAKERNVLRDCIDNYAIEVSYAYKKGELAVNHMNEEELEAFYNCVRVIVRNRHLMKSDVAELFRNA